MRKLTLVVTVLFMMLAFGAMQTARAQEESKDSSAKTPRVEEPVEAYRVDISFNELEDGKKLNTRHYSIDLTGGRPNEIKIGTRIPVAAAGNSKSSSSSESDSAPVQYQYIDLGMHVWAQLISHGNELHISSEISSLDTTAGPERSAALLPVVRQIRIEGSTALVLGKPIIIGSADDPNSKRQFELAVTVTKLR